MAGVGFQSPSLRGSGRFEARARAAERRACSSFQSPSLRGSGRFEPVLRLYALRSPFQSPSLRGSGRFFRHGSGRGETPSRFNPLHCGAVVASAHLLIAFVIALGVSIPFIAGQWSLRGCLGVAIFLGVLFQSPSLRGSGRFNVQYGALGGTLWVSIPFIAGQWSLQVVL